MGKKLLKVTASETGGDRKRTGGPASSRKKIGSAATASEAGGPAAREQARDELRGGTHKTRTSFARRQLRKGRGRGLNEPPRKLGAVFEKYLLTEQKQRGGTLWEALHRVAGRVPRDADFDLDGVGDDGENPGVRKGDAAWLQPKPNAPTNKPETWADRLPLLACVAIPNNETPGRTYQPCRSVVLRGARYTSEDIAGDGQAVHWQAGRLTLPGLEHAKT